MDNYSREELFQYPIALYQSYIHLLYIAIIIDQRFPWQRYHCRRGSRFFSRTLQKCVVSTEFLCPSVLVLSSESREIQNIFLETITAVASFQPR
jgi:hypothetical protein